MRRAPKHLLTMTSEPGKHMIFRITFTACLALGLLGKQARGWFGLSFEYGQADTKVAGGTLDLDSALRGGLELDDQSTVTRWTLSGIIGSSYSFFREPEPNE